MFLILESLIKQIRAKCDGSKTEWMFCTFSNVTADVRCEGIKGKSCVNFEDKSLKNIKPSIQFVSEQIINPKVMTVSFFT